jgi:glycosyltransferase involved in cell wall biosynthesis
MDAAPDDPPVRVLQVLTCDAPGGTEQMVATVSERVDRSRVVCDVVTLDRPGPIAQRLTDAGVRVASLGNAGTVRAYLRLAAVLHRRRPQVVNAYGFKATMMGRMLTRCIAPDAAFVSGVRGLHFTDVADVDGRKSRLVLAVERAFSGLDDVYDCNSRGALELLARHGIARARLTHIPNGVELPGDAPQPRRPGDRLVIVCVARLSAIKRHEDLLRAAALLADRVPAFELLLVGGGTEEAALRELASELGVVERVTFAGAVSRDGVRDALSRSDIFCLPSLWEGMPGSVMEAMAEGLPVVGTDVNGIADLVSQGRTGLLVPPCDPEALAGALAQLAGDAELRERFGRAARQRIADEFSVGRMIRAKEDLYRGLAKGRLPCAASVAS